MSVEVAFGFLNKSVYLFKIFQIPYRSGQEEPDPEASVKEAGAALVAVLETLFGIDKED